MMDIEFSDNFEHLYEDDDYAEQMYESDGGNYDNPSYQQADPDDGYPNRNALPQQLILLPVFLAIAGVLILIFTIFSAIGFTPVSTQAGSSPAQDSNQSKGKGIAPLFTPEVQYWSNRIVNWSKQTGIDANLIATVMQIESCGDPQAQSGVGAIGLFQVMPYHFHSEEDPFKPATNARRGLGYLNQALTARDGNVRYALAGYNGGITGAKRPESQWPAETQRYVTWGMGIYKDAKKGGTQSEHLEEWLGRGGASLCAQAAKQLGINP